jgi:ATP-dependent DNA helicase RecQ
MEQSLAWSEVAETAARVFGVRTFRAGQRELIEAVLARRDALGILPPGGGKSLCFQLPSLFLPGVVVVVSPLVSLGEDQTDQLERPSISAARTDSTLTAGKDRTALVQRQPLEIVYVTPERLTQPAFTEKILMVGCSLLVVDEAHCISEGGHDFRPAFLAIRHAARALGRPPILALTATATPAVERDILQELELRDPLVVRTSCERPNLHLSVRHCATEAAKLAVLQELVAAEPGTVLVYTATIRKAYEVWTRLIEADIVAGIYHGDLEPVVRDITRDAFMDGRYRVIVATRDFGPGIDQARTRLVIHAQVPGSLERYYQEVGRAGRDGEPARGVLLYRRADARIQRFFLAGKHSQREEVEQAVEWWFGAREAELPGRSAKVLLNDLERISAMASTRERMLTELTELYERRRAEDGARLERMLAFAEEKECRMQGVRAYFGEKGERCSQCDYCDERAERVLR